MRITVIVEPDLGEGCEVTAMVPAEEYLPESASDTVVALCRERGTVSDVLTRIVDHITSGIPLRTPIGAPGEVSYRRRRLGGEA